MKSNNIFRTYVLGVMSPYLVGMKRILTDSNGYIQQAVNQTSALVTQAQNAATDADASKTQAGTYESQAQSSAQNAADNAAVVKSTSDQLTALLRSFAAVWYGALAEDPTKDPNGNAPVIGAEYWNTTRSVIRIYGSNGWEDIDADALADAKNAALSASQASGYATAANQYTQSAQSSAAAAAANAAAVKSYADQMTAILPDLDSDHIGYFLRLDPTGTKYVLSSPTESLSDMNGATLTSPAFKGTPTAPTAVLNTNTGQIATCAFILNQASNVLPLANATTAAIGTSFLYARADHVHASDPNGVSGILGATSGNGDLQGVGLHWDGRASLIYAGFRPLGYTSGTDKDVWYAVARDDQVVHLSGSTMIGNLVLGSASSNTNPSLILDGPSNTTRQIQVRSAGVTHWGFGGTSDATSGSNSGDNFSLTSYDDKGVYLKNIFVVNRQDGSTTFSSPLAAGSTLTVTGSVSAYSGGTSVNINAPTTGWAYTNFQVNSSDKWHIAVQGNPGASNSGADLIVQSWEGSTLIDTPFMITRSTGAVTISKGWSILSTDNNSTTGAQNQSARSYHRLDKRNVNFFTSQYAEETVGTEVRHVLQVSGGSTSYFYRFSQSGTLSANIFSGTATQTEYADLAELYTCNQKLSPGTFVKIARNSEYDIELAPAGSKFYFGIISTNPGYLLNSTCAGLPVALTGRVPTLVEGSIYKGDPITISKTRAGVGEYGESNIIGFALETNLDTGVKLIEVAVGGRGG